MAGEDFPAITPPVTRGTRLAVPDHVYARAFGRETVLLDFERGDYFGLNEVGSVLWATVTEGGTLGDAVVAVARGFECADEARIERDLHALAGELLTAGLLRIELP